MVTEYVPGPSIAAWLVQEGPLPIDEVIAMLKNTTAALLEYHGRGLVYGPMYPDEIHIERPARLRLSPLSITDFVSEMENSHGRFPHDPKAATYLGPDQFHGRAPDALSDQYALGLLAFVMLQGHPPCQVSRLVDFDRKREFFRDPGGKAGAWRDRHPAFSQVLFTMLRENPAERWPSLQALLKELEGLDDAQHALAKFAHATHCENRPAFAEAFYRRYFARCPETIAYFGDLQSQYDKLNEALVFLLIFRGASVQATGTSLDHVARHHRTLNITPAHFDIFFECLLETLRDDCHADAAMVSAWQHVMAPGFAFLKQRCCPMLPPKPALTRQVEQPVCTA
jgi:hemoglobin-like flavoprotein